MRRYRGVVVILVSLVLSTGMFAVPRDSRENPRENPIVKIVKAVKRVLKSLGDGISVPTP